MLSGNSTRMCRPRIGTNDVLRSIVPDIAAMRGSGLGAG